MPKFIEQITVDVPAWPADYDPEGSCVSLEFEQDDGELRTEDSNTAAILEFFGPDCISVTVTSFDDDGGHEVFREMAGKTVRVTVEIIE